MSRSVIIDNSTLSSVSRLIGAHPVRKSYSVEGDYSAFENFCNSVLFFDDIYFIDDYVEEHREIRRETFPYIRKCFDENDRRYHEIEQVSIKVTEDLVLEINAGEVTSEHVRRLLDVMNLTVTSNWIMRSSVFYLTLQLVVGGEEAHDKYKYTPLTETIFRQLSHKNKNQRTPDPRLISSAAEDLLASEGDEKDRIEQQLLEFSASLQWLMRRSVFYLLSAKHFGASVGIHPVRHQFTNAYGQQIGLIDSSNAWTERVDEFFSETAVETLKKILQLSEPSEMLIDIPVFSSWALSKADTVSDAIQLLLDYRATSQGERVRARFRELDRMHAGGEKVKEINKIRSAIQLEAAEIPKKFGVTDFNVATNVSLSASMIPSAGMTIPFKKALRAARPSPVQSLFRSLVRDIADFQNLGALKGKLLRQVKRVENLDDGFSSATVRHEDVRYYGRASDWKHPM